MVLQLNRGCSAVANISKRLYHGRALIGKREVVGYGLNGEYAYIDRLDYPYPAIRWAEPDSKTDSLREKEKGDWKNLSIEDKKNLYRYSYRQTFAELDAPDGTWKFGLGGMFFIAGCAVWVYSLLKTFVYNGMPESCKEENKRAQMERMALLGANPIQGVGSLYDYEKGTWK